MNSMDSPLPVSMADIYQFRSDMDYRQETQEARQPDGLYSYNPEFIDSIQYELLPELVSEARVPLPEFKVDHQDSHLSMESPLSSSSISSSMFEVPNFTGFSFPPLDEYKFTEASEPQSRPETQNVFYSQTEFDNVETINTVELTKPFDTQKYSTTSPVLKSQKDEDAFESSDSQLQSPRNLSLDFDDRKKDNKYKKISDSRLSLSQLSHVLQLPNDIQETAKREKQILTIFKKDLNFPLGEKTWIRDTPSEERNILIDKLWKLVEMKHQYGYSKETLAIVIRRASYYLMQGRLRRERRLEKKKNGDIPWKRKSKSY